MHDSRTGRLFLLNSWGAVALEALRPDARHDDIVDVVVRHAGIDPATATRDLQTFVESLRKEDLLQSDDAHEPLKTDPPRPPDSAASLEASYRIGKRTIRVVCHPEDIARAFAPLAAPCAIPKDASAETCLTLFRHEGAFVLLENDREIDRASSAQGARWALVRELVGEGRGKPWLALLHAGAVLTPEGCFLLCGESGAGKSTLLAGLVHAGFPFVADDIALLERGTGLIWSTPLAISIKENSWSVLARLFPKLAKAPVVQFCDRTMRYLQPDPADVAADTGHPIRGVLFVRYSEHATTTLERLKIRESLVRLGQGGSILPDTDDGLGEFLKRWQKIPAWQLTYGKLGDAVYQLQNFSASGHRHGAAAI